MRFNKAIPALQTEGPVCSVRFNTLASLCRLCQRPCDSVGSGRVSKDTSAAVAARFGVIAASSSTAMEVRARFLLLGCQEDSAFTNPQAIGPDQSTVGGIIY